MFLSMIKKYAARCTLHAARLSERGVAVIMVATAMTALLGFAAVAIDLAFVMETRAELQNTADAAALAGASGLAISDNDENARQTEARRRALHFDDGAKNTVLGQPINLAAFNSNPLVSPVEVGQWNPISRTFQPWDQVTPTNAVRVTLQLTPDTTPKLPPMFFGPVINANVTEVGVEAIAALAPGKNNKRDLILLLDRSGSMDDDSCGGAPPCGVVPQQPLTKVKDSAKEFFNIIEAGSGSEQAGLIYYNQSPVLNAALTGNFSQVKGAIDSGPPQHLPSASGQTGIAAALCVALREFHSASVQPSATHVIALLSDGLPNEKMDPAKCEWVPLVPLFPRPWNLLPSPQEQARQQASLIGGDSVGVVLYAIAFGARADQTFMKDLAQRGNGKFFFAPTADQLRTIFEEIAKSGEPDFSLVR